MWIDDRFGTYWRRQASWWEVRGADGQWRREMPDGPLRQITTGGTPPVRTVRITSFELWRGTQAQYDAIPTKNPTTLYVIT